MHHAAEQQLRQDVTKLLADPKLALIELAAMA
jgi:hypothetical protein